MRPEIMRNPRWFAGALALSLTVGATFAWSAVGSAAGSPGASPAGGPPSANEEGLRDLAAAEENHRGPNVAVSDTGPARVVPALLEAFDADAAMSSVAFMDRYYRAPANEGYEASLDHLAERLRTAGFGSTDGLELDVLSEDMRLPAWTPRSGSMDLVVDGASERLHGFVESSDVDRVMLPVNAVSCDVRGKVALDLAHLEPGGVLVTTAPTSQVLLRARHNEAAAVISASLATFNSDPKGEERHLDAIQFVTDRQRARLAEGDEPLPVAQMSPRSFGKVRAAVERGADVWLELKAEVELEQRPLRTLQATIVGSTRPEEAVAVASHVQEPGACDNASGAAGLGEAAITLARLLAAGEVDRPKRTIVFLWGNEFQQSQIWLRRTERRPVAGFSSDMTGESRERTGAIALLERTPDPGALLTVPPDEHTPWGAGKTTESDLNPNALAIVARCAMIDVSRFSGGDWVTADHPWEGGSDHDEFIAEGVPAVLFWHFTDFAYHTSLDRLGMVDPQELKRTQVALLASVYAVADPREEDVERYRQSIEMERLVRETAAKAVGRNDIADLWREWSKGSERWLEREMKP